MTMNIGRVLSEGFSRSTRRNGVILVAIFSLLSAMTIVAFTSLLAAFAADSFEQPPMTVGPTISLPPVVAGVTLVVSYLGTFVATAVALPDVRHGRDPDDSSRVRHTKRPLVPVELRRRCHCV